MTGENVIQEIFFKFLMQYQYEAQDLDYSLMPGHIAALQSLSVIGNQGVSIFDVNKKEMAFFSPNFGKQLGYTPADYENLNYHFFDAKMHPEDKVKLVVTSITVLKLFNAFSRDEKLNHKVVYEYRMLNADNVYIRLIEQYQILELDKKGQIWLMLSIVDVSPNQEADTPVKCQLLNFRTGNIIPFEIPKEAKLELTRRETEILKLVKKGYLSKEISDQLSISVHTVNTHRQRLLEKLGANNSMEAVIFATRFGLLA